MRWRVFGAIFERDVEALTGFQVPRDFEGLSGHLHAYKVDVAKAMLTMCRAVDARVLLVCSSTSTLLSRRPIESRALTSES